MEKVSIERVPDYDRERVEAGVRSVVASLGGMERFVRPGERVLLKPNLLAGKAPEKAVTTHPEVVRAVIGLVREAGGVPVVGDSPGIGGARKVAEKAGILAVLEETGTELVEFSETVTASGSGTFREIPLARAYMVADRVINLPKLKTHEMMTMTCAVKNLFGAVVGTEKAGWHLKAGADKELFARLLLEIWQLRPPELTIVDAVVGMEGDGPGSGDPKHLGLLLAGENAVAVDVVAAETACIPRKLLYVENAARAAGITGSTPEEIEIVGAKPEEVRSPFRLPAQADVQFGLPKFLKNRLRHYLTTRPCEIPEKCLHCGICRDACPPRSIEISGGRLRFDYHSCIRCFCCRELCPEGALDVKEGALLKIFKKFNKSI
jgi:uncharacterized protein (DUF362 family)/Pyruvate/2-oxoacid:ferredoxin oxidoreductase delta subunit